MIKLYSFGPAFGLVDPSPFVTKVNLFMTMHGIEFESICDAAKLSKAPKKKFPFIEDDGDVIADSMFIIDYLSEKHGIDMDSWLSDEQRATAHLIGKSLEENLYWCLVHSRWINQDTWPIIKQHFFANMPFPLNVIVPYVARRSTIKRINGHGMGSHSDAHINEIAQSTLASLSTLLADKPYIFGDKISSLDLVIFAQVGALTMPSLDNEINRMARKYDNLLELTQKIRQQYYPQLLTHT